MREKLFVKENLKPVLVLSVICLIVAALLGGVNLLTADVIKAAEEQKVYDSLREVLDGTFAPAEIPEGAPESVTALYKVTDGDTDVGHVVTLKVKGYAGDILMTVGVDADGKVTKAVITAQAETHGKAGMANYTDNYTGVSSDTVSDVELFTGATVSSTAIKGAVIDALNTVTGSSISSPDNGGEEALPKTDEEIKAVCEGMAEGDITLTDLTPDGAPDTLKRAYDAGDSGYFLYIVVPGQYVPVATEAVVHINNDGEIVKVNLLQWVVGHDVTSGDFADGFIGADKDTAGDVELVTGATGTSSDFRDAVKEALVYFVETYELVEALPKTDDEIKAIASEMAGKEFTLSDFTVNSAPETLKRVYSAGDDGYFLYIVVPGDYVPVATEALVHLNTDCEIVKVNLLSWIVGHGVEPGDFADGFTGTNKDTVGDVELVTGATGTSLDFRDALEAAVITVSDGDEAKENLLLKKIEALVPNAEGFDPVELSADAPKSLKKLYKVVGYDGYVAYLITSTKYVDVETESIVYINSNGKVGNIQILTWTVGHGVEPGDFASALIGKGAEELGEVELVTSATVTAGNLRDAIVDAIGVIPVDYTPLIVGAVVLALSIACAVTVIIIKRRKNR